MTSTQTLAPTTAMKTAPIELAPSYFRAVDGLRAVAILSVLVFHTGLYANGIFGVDLFFVLSGFLITLTLLREFHRTGGISLGRFYLRRAKRLLPMLVIMLSLTLWAVVQWGSRDELARFSRQAVASLAYVTNWEQIAAGQNYWDGFNAINPLGHMWSLAITEQFYLVWPLLMIAVLAVGKRISDRRGPYGWQGSRTPAVLVLVLSVVGVWIGALSTAIRFDGTNADRLYLGTDTHFVGLVAGAAAGAISYLMLQQASRGTKAATAAHGKRPVREAMYTTALTAGSAALLVAIVTLSVRATSYSEAWLFEYGLATVAVLGALFTLTLTSPRNALGRVFSYTPLVELGKVSYTLFLIHMPVFWLVRALHPASTPTDILVLGLPISILLASGLHHLVAEPIRLRTWSAKGKSVLFGAMAAVCAAAIVLPSVLLTAPAGTGDIRVLTLGDSLANDFASALSRDSVNAFTVFDGGLPGCGVSGSTAQRTRVDITQQAPKGCNPWQERWATQIENAQPDVIVVNTAWDAVAQEIDGVWVDITDPQFATSYRAALDEVATITQATGATVLISNSRLHNGVVTPEQAAAFNEVLAGFLADNPSIRLLDLQGEVCDENDCAPLLPNGEKRYLDNRVHFSDAGKSDLAPWLTSEILAAAQPR